jgi:hypothetical protein
MDPELLDVAADRWHRRWVAAVVERGREVRSAPPATMATSPFRGQR